MNRVTLKEVNEKLNILDQLKRVVIAGATHTITLKRSEYIDSELGWNTKEVVIDYDYFLPHIQEYMNKLEQDLKALGFEEEK